MAAYTSQVLALYRGGQVRTASYQYVEGGALAFVACRRMPTAWRKGGRPQKLRTWLPTVCQRHSEAPRRARSSAVL